MRCGYLRSTSCKHRKALIILYILVHHPMKSSTKLPFLADQPLVSRTTHACIRITSCLSLFAIIIVVDQYPFLALKNVIVDATSRRMTVKNMNTVSAWHIEHRAFNWS